MKAYWLDESGNAGDSIDVDTLRGQGIPCDHLDTEPARYQGPLDELKARQGYVEQDQIELRPDTPNLEQLCAKFLDEHHHDEDEVRFVLDGAGIFDIRSNDDRWMRVQVDAGDLIVVPAGRHHRFMLTDLNSIRCVRLFKDASGWVPHYRHRVTA